MRILFLHHFPLSADAAGRLVERWALALVFEGHEVRALVVDDGTQGDEPFPLDRVVCHGESTQRLAAVDALNFALPGFGDDVSTPGARFATLTDAQLAGYRHALRERLDRQIDHFNPHIIHAQHVWVQGQLALESGVPYVLNAWGPELVDYQSDARYRPIASQAAENASRILVPDEALRRQIVETFEIVPERAIVMPAALSATASDLPPRAIASALTDIYQAVLNERFGPAD